MFSQEMRRDNRGSGFTLIELLVVIAIIAILAALLFPVFGTFKENVRKNTCMSKMHDVWSAVSQYKLDTNKYPETLYDYAELPSGAYYIGSGTPAPMANAKARPLFAISGGKYLKDPSVFTCPDVMSDKQTDVTTAVYPTAPGVTLVGQVPNAF